MSDAVVDAPPPRYPVALTVANRPCVVIGGGAVATRKVAALLEAGARVRVISPTLSAVLAELAAAGRLTAERRAYRTGDLNGAFLAVAATDDRAVNAAVAAEARAERALVTVCDDPAASDVVGVAVIRQGGLTVTVSTEGQSPAVARLVRETLEEVLTPEYAAVLALVAAERAAAGRPGAGRSRLDWRAAITPEVLALVRAGELAAARARLRASLAAPSTKPDRAGG
jgi:siroheme synthase-like protein